MRIQWILKRHECYGVFTYVYKCSGLYNSTRFVVEALKARGIETDLVVVNDNNDIDREVTRFQPDIVILEALWVVPDKFDVLMPLHPNVKWFVHLHSAMPFLAQEGMSMGWILDCVKRGVGMIANSRDAFTALDAVLSEENLVYLPNVYKGVQQPIKVFDPSSPALNVACFGAIRPLKNQLLQALAAIQFANDLGEPLRFHINSTRLEAGGAPIIQNLRDLFTRVPGTELVEHQWYTEVEFAQILTGMDIGMQVSLSETFNIVSADYVTAGLPIVVSKEIPWATRWCFAQDDAIDDIVNTMQRVFNNQLISRLNQWMLERYSDTAAAMWKKWTDNF